MGLAKRPGSTRVLPWYQTQPTPAKANGHRKHGISSDRAREFEMEI
jgi:hypothetical protein